MHNKKSRVLAVSPLIKVTQLPEQHQTDHVTSDSHLASVVYYQISSAIHICYRDVNSATR